jgi:hypothetical protein
MTITWAAYDDVSVDSVHVDYSTDGATWVDVLVTQPSSGTYSWTYPATLSEVALYVRVRAWDNLSNVGTTTVRVGYECDPCSGDDPDNDPFRIPD